MSKAGYLPSTTDTSYGTHSGDVAVQTNAHSFKGSSSVHGTTSHALTRVEASTTPEGMVEVPGIGLTSRAAAEAAGLQYRVPGNHVAVTSGNAPAPVETQRHLANNEYVPTDTINRYLDWAEQELGHEGMHELANTIVNDPDSGAIEAIPESVQNAYWDHAADLCAAHGLENVEAMAMLLDDEQNAEALAALISGNEQKFGLYVQETIRRAHSAATDPDFVADLEEAGGHVVNDNLIVDGQVVGNISELILNGYIGLG